MNKIIEKLKNYLATIQALIEEFATKLKTLRDQFQECKDLKDEISKEVDSDELPSVNQNKKLVSEEATSTETNEETK